MTTFKINYSGGVVKLYRDINSNYKILPVNDGASPTPTNTPTSSPISVTPTITPTPTAGGGGIQGFVVSSAGSSAFNGTYCPDGTLNGKTRYKLTGSNYTIEYTNNWVVNDEENYGPTWLIQAGNSDWTFTQYYNISSSATPPLSGWAAYLASAPAPTLSSTTCGLTPTPTQTPTPTKSPAGSLLTIARNNGTSTFTGAGTFASPFTRAAGIYLEEVDGLSRYSWTASGTATVTVKFDFSDDDGSDDSALIKKNGTIIHYVSSSVNSTRTVSVVSGDIITISSTQPVDSQYFSNVSVYAQA